MDACWADGKKAYTKENSHPLIDERNSKLRDDHAMKVLGVPDVGVLKPVDVHLEPAIGIDVHVGDEEMCHKPSLPPSFEYSPDCILFGTWKFSSLLYQLAVFLF